MKRYLISVSVVLAILIAAWTALGQEERPGRARAKPSEAGERPRYLGREEMLKAVQIIQDQVTKIKAGVETIMPTPTRDLSEEERTKIRETFRKVREERQKAIEVIEEQLVRLKDPRQLREKHEQFINELNAIRELAIKEKAEGTGKRLQELIEKQQKDFEQKLQKSTPLPPLPLESPKRKPLPSRQPGQ